MFRRLLAAVIAIVLGIAIGFTTYHVSVQPGAAVVKAVFETGAEVTPPSDFSSIESKVIEHRGVALTPAGAPSATLNLYLPSGPRTTTMPIILWIHGGGFISSSADTVRDYAIMLANSGYLVANLDYTLAPGARHPVPVRQANAALLYLQAHGAEFGGDPSRLIVGGDSAGAQIASELAAAETDTGLADSLKLGSVVTAGSLRGVVLFCGLYDMSTVGSTGFPALRTYLWAYTGVRDWTSYTGINALSTTRQVTPDYPSTFISVGDADPFRTQASELVTALNKQKVPVDSLFWNGSGAHLSHEYQFDFALAQAKVAFTRTLAFLAANTKG